MVELVEVTGGLQALYVEYAIKLAKVQSRYAEGMNLTDEHCKNYSEKDALKHMTDEKYKHYILFVEHSIPVGILQLHFVQKHGNMETRVKKLYIDESQRNKGYATEVLKAVTDKYSAVALKCWYGMPVGNLFENAGFKEPCKYYLKRDDC